MYTLENLQILKVPINGDSIKRHKEYESRADRTVQNVHLNDAYWQQSCLYNSINNSIYLIRVKALIIFIYKYINASFNQPLTFEDEWFIFSISSAFLRTFFDSQLFILYNMWNIEFNYKKQTQLTNQCTDQDIFFPVKGNVWWIFKFACGTDGYFRYLYCTNISFFQEDLKHLTNSSQS